MGAHPDGQDAQSSGREGVDDCQGPFVVPAQGQHRVRGSLDDHRTVDHDRHASGPRVEGEAQLVGVIPAVGVGVDAQAAGTGVERRLHGVAVRPPPAVDQHGVAGGAPDRGEGELGAGVLRTRGRPRELRLGLVALARQRQRPRRSPGLHDLHLVLGQGAGLVRADERGRAKRLDGFEVAHQDLPLGHLLGAPGQREGHRRQQRLGHQCHGDTDGEDEAVLERVAHQQGDEEEEAADTDGDQRRQAHHALQTQGQRGDRLRRRRRQPGDGGQPRAPAGGHDDGTGLALDDERPGIQRLAGRDGDGGALPRQHRGVDEQTVGHDDPGVGRHAVPTLEQEQVVDHDVLGLDDPTPSVAPDRHPRRQHGAQALGRPVGPGLLGEREHGVEQDDREDGDAELGEAGEQREHAGHPEHDREEVGQLTDETTCSGGPARRREQVGPLGSPACGSDGRSEAGCADDRHAGPLPLSGPACGGSEPSARGLGPPARSAGW